MRFPLWRSLVVAVATSVAVSGLSGCAWRGLNSYALPGTQGGGPGSYRIQVQLDDIQKLEQNARVRVNDVSVGRVAEIHRQGWHALLTLQLQGDVKLPANATANIGQTSLLGSFHVELGEPSGAPEGKLHEGSLIPLAHTTVYPSVEQTLAALSTLLNGGGIGQMQDIIQAFSTALHGRGEDARSLTTQLEIFADWMDRQSNDVIAAVDSLNNLSGKFAAQKPIVDKALKTIPDALAVLKDERENITEAADQLGKFSQLAANTIDQSKTNLVREFKEAGPVLESLANAGKSLTRSLNWIPTTPFVGDQIKNWQRGDHANLTAIIDLTLSRLDAGFFTGTKWECALTELELQWGRTIGQYPSPCLSDIWQFNHGNPLAVPYNWGQGE